MQTSAAGNFQPTESLFAVYREPFFNTIGQNQKSSPRANLVRFSSSVPILKMATNQPTVRQFNFGQFTLL
jgi:hypothetical protein